MFGSTGLQHSRDRGAKLQRNLRAVETGLSNLVSRNTSRTSGDVADSVGAALEELANRLREGAGYAADEASRLGRRANAAGRNSYEVLKNEVDAHPFVVLGVAAGIAASVGILVGASLYRYSKQQSPNPKRRRRAMRSARK
jgi:hypothetical protein